MYSLWQNGVQLGRLIHVEEEPSDDGEPLGFVGILCPLAPLHALRKVRQRRFAFLPGIPVTQEFPDEQPPIPFGPELRIYPPPPELHAGPDGNGVPFDEVFSVRTDAGVDVPSSVIAIERHDLPVDVDASADLREAGLPEDLRSIFVVHLAHETAFPPRFIEMMKQLHDERRE